VEIGASVGAFCSAVKPYIANVVGVEPSQDHAAHLTSVGVTAVPYLDKLDPQEKFDAAAFFHVLEHMRRPVEFLQDVAKVLNDQAYIFVEVPNVNDALLSLYHNQAFTDFYYQAMHCVYFSPETLTQVFQQAGFSTVELIPKQRYDISNHMVWMSEGKPGGNGRFKQVFSSDLEASYADSLKDKWLCDTIFGVFRRE
jgi:2-polyprenyl-3-methyl-5-hydroxy-6-metoxy-1,4-benzoquinol methylase